MHYEKDRFRDIEAEHEAIQASIDVNKRLAARSEQLLYSSRGKPAGEGEGEPEAA